jgi:hypothetical protein
LIWLEAKNGSGYTWIDDDKYEQEDYAEHWNEVKGDTVIILGWVSGDYEQYQKLVGSAVKLDAGGKLSPVATFGTVTITIHEEEECVRNLLNSVVGGTATKEGVENESDTTYADAEKALLRMGFERYNGDPHPDHWGGNDIRTS